MLADHEARIAALERLVGKLALENEFLKEVSRHARQARSARTSVIAGPLVSPSQKDAG
jgi:transposase